MFLKKKTMNYTTDYLAQIKQLKGEIETADAILIGAGAGLSTAAGFTYSGKRFEDNFADFIEKYQFQDMYTAGFYPFQTLEEFWAYWSRHIYINRYDQPARKVYLDLLDLVKDKDYFVLTTNVDHQFQLAGFDKKRLFYTQGDYGLVQCSKPCEEKNYDNEEIIREMIAKQKDMRIPSELIPYCPTCGSPMRTNLREDNTFVQDEGWYEAAHRYKVFIDKNKTSHILYLELGVGANTPSIIKYPFWQMTVQNENAVYACLNLGEVGVPTQLKNQYICINQDVSQTLIDLIDCK